MILQYLRATPCAPSTPSGEVYSRGDANYDLCGFADFISLLTDDDGDPFQPNLRLVDGPCRKRVITVSSSHCYNLAVVETGEMYS